MRTARFRASVMDMRAALLLSVGLLSSSLVACAEPKEAADPGEIVREETVNRVGPISRASSRTVRCGCDLDGDLHVQAPQGSSVTVPEDATHPSEAQIVLPDDGPAPLRTTKSLGFVGDGKLSDIPSRGTDGLLPPHEHGGGRWSGQHFLPGQAPYPYPYAPAPYAPYRGGSWTPTPPAPPAPPAPVYQGQGGSYSGSFGAPASPPLHIGPGWR